MCDDDDDHENIADSGNADDTVFTLRRDYAKISGHVPSPAWLLTHVPFNAVQKAFGASSQLRRYMTVIAHWSLNIAQPLEGGKYYHGQERYAKIFFRLSILIRAIRVRYEDSDAWTRIGGPDLELQVCR
jgi:hypothetical protein